MAMVMMGIGMEMAMEVAMAMEMMEVAMAMEMMAMAMAVEMAMDDGLGNVNPDHAGSEPHDDDVQLLRAEGVHKRYSIKKELVKTRVKASKNDES